MWWNRCVIAVWWKWLEAAKKSGCTNSLQSCVIVCFSMLCIQEELGQLGINGKSAGAVDCADHLPGKVPSPASPDGGLCFGQDGDNSSPDDGPHCAPGLGLGLGGFGVPGQPRDGWVAGLFGCLRPIIGTIIGKATVNEIKANQGEQTSILPSIDKSLSL